MIQNYLKEIDSSLYEKSRTGDFAELCSDMNIISMLPEYVKPKNVGLMFFCMEPDKFFLVPRLILYNSQKDWAVTIS